MKTTLNLRLSDLPVLQRASDESGLSKSELIERCLGMLYLNDKYLRKSLIGRLVEYQPRGDRYKIIHVTFCVLKYNFNVNFRVFSRCSVSLLVTLAISLYLDDVLNNRDLVNTKDNYLGFSQDLRHNQDNSEEKWIVKWEIKKKRQT